MKSQLATGYVPYEINDLVKLKTGEIIWEVVEIRLTQYVAAKKAIIELQLLDKTDGTKIWRKVDRIEKRVK